MTIDEILEEIEKLKVVLKQSDEIKKKEAKIKLESLTHKLHALYNQDEIVY
jgi:predicted transcriptional regulator